MKMSDQASASTATGDQAASPSSAPAVHPATQIAQSLHPLPEDGDELEAV